MEGRLMATLNNLIPEYKWTDFIKVQKLGRLKELKCGEVTFNGEYLFTFVNGSIEVSGYRRTQAEYDSQIINSVGGVTIEKILEAELAPV